MLRSLNKALALLDAFTPEKAEWALGDLSRALGFPKPTVHHMLATLEHAGWVEQISENGKYRLGVRLWEKGWLAINHTPLRDLARLAAEGLAKRSQETIRLAVLDAIDPGFTVYIDQVDSSNPIRAHTRIGDRAPSHCVATGKALLAFMPAAVERLRSRQLPRFTARTITTHARLGAELDRARKQGFAINRKEYREDIVGVAAPIMSHEGHVVAAIGISGPAYRLSPSRITSLTPAVIEAASLISSRLGFRERPLRAGPHR